MSQKPFTLLTNDDGLHAEGIQAVQEGLKDLIDPLVVAPARERSGASHSVSLGRDLHLQEAENNVYSFDGTPVDCVLFTLRNLVRDKPDFCISGINHGANLGNDTLCSGTVGAALAAANEGIPSIAISMVGRGPYHMATAIHVLKQVFAMRHKVFSKIHSKVLNINVPNIPVGELQGLKVAKLGERIWSEEFVAGKDPGSFRYHHEEPINFGGSEFDVTAVQDGFASLTVLEPNLMDRHSHDILEDLAKEWKYEPSS
ncbi:5'/3'-nucleotidase SurE [Pseudobacteriovorax antillogorgiicola]|uniref:5'-nucleotidase SurE n=1 Tax=Pseudobacteriovorax antillogorgiicola TaxID=1513793 RepID=A0A1Y6CL55_9BACT|nr:5'/3'-nucleotidase SurE [Pseudobacteriovorax antillogorgiicola]TCS47283.1 5'-nucleotidase /3'-nucleotidase /exopolyphosphatase [Pseudobacteriovorax antillogorgiicola]SMF62316.1 5'-nucleotidase /3'-nucleotidase /exopolyphosphatase [Pseudobacteriovorax antillogorgiicola]